MCVIFCWVQANETISNDANSSIYSLLLIRTNANPSTRWCAPYLHQGFKTMNFKCGMECGAEALMVPQKMCHCTPCEKARRDGSCASVRELEIWKEKKTNTIQNTTLKYQGLSNLIAHRRSRLRATCSSASIWSFCVLALIYTCSCSIAVRLYFDM
jgi:hypothetical protein